MTHATLVGADLVAISILVFALYFPRYRRRDMVVALLGLNVGVLAVATTLSTADVGAGLGLGLFGVLSIIRLRSSELGQEEIAYYFAALALGLLGGVDVTGGWLAPTLMAAVVGVLFVGDHPRLFARHRTRTVTLDAAYPDDAEAIAVLESLLGGTVTRLRVRKLDLVQDTTVVDVSYHVDAGPAAGGLANGGLANGGLANGSPAQADAAVVEPTAAHR